MLHPGPIRLTEVGRRELEEELSRLESARPALAAQIRDAREGGVDAAENLDLRDAMDALGLHEGRIAELKALLASAEPLEVGLNGDGGAHLGAEVRVRHQDGEEASYMLVAPPEAAPRRGRLSVESPIGRALVGRKPGEEVVAETPNGLERLVVLQLS